MEVNVVLEGKEAGPLLWDSSLLKCKPSSKVALYKQFFQRDRGFLEFPCSVSLSDTTQGIFPSTLNSTDFRHLSVCLFLMTTCSGRVYSKTFRMSTRYLLIDP